MRLRPAVIAWPARWLALACVAAALTSAPAFAQVRPGKPAPAVADPSIGRFEGIGRTATAAEVKAWDIDVRADFKGLPSGQGSVKRGEQVWEAQCASCHGSFGESNDVFTPIVGFTTKKDIETGHVAALLPGANAPTRTTLMKVSQLSSLWDYINRAMPWTAPKSLSADDVYAVTAYILSLGDIVPEDFTLSDRNIADVQKRLPNRNGVTTAHGLWPGKELGGTGKPDVQGSSCMTDCPVSTAVASRIPDYARNAHGNLAEQTRTVGSTRGANTAVAAPAAPSAPASAPAQAADTAATIMPLLQKNVCIACHAVDVKIVGPAFNDVAARHKGKPGSLAYLAGRIRSGGQGDWGAIPMPPQSIGEADAQRIARWLVNGAPK